MLDKVSVGLILVVVWVIFALASPTFATLVNLQTLLAVTAVTAVAAAAETLVLLTGGFDLSIATVVSCSGVLSVVTMGLTGSTTAGILVALAVGLAFGFANGLAVGGFGVNSFVFSLGTYLVARGIAFTVSQGIAVKGATAATLTLGDVNVLGIPAIAFIAILVFVLLNTLLSKTSWGRFVYLVGSNEPAARYVGIRSRLITVSVYVVAGLLSGLAGYLAVANLGVALPGVGDTILLPLIGGVIVGGTSLFGGEGSIWRTALGVLILAFLGNGLSLLGWAFYDQLIAEGVVILVGTGLAATLVARRRLRG